MTEQKKRLGATIRGAGAKAEAPLEPGQVVGGRIVIEEMIGVGGMGVVFAGRDLISGAPVAVKTILGGLNRREEVVRRFLRETNVLRRLKSEHAVRVFGSGTLPGGTPFLVMERLRGEDLRYVQHRRGSVSLAEAADWIAQACEALAEVHALGIVHRDLKLSNLFLTRRPDGRDSIKVLDFGIAKFTSPNVAGDDVEMTLVDSQLGARVYLSPEQLTSAKDVDARSDVWSLGVILHYLLAGDLPFAGRTPEQIVFNALEKDPIPITSVRPNVPPRFEEVILRCLQKSRDARYPSVIALLRAISPFTSRMELTKTLPLNAPVAESIRSGTLPLAPRGHRIDDPRASSVPPPPATPSEPPPAVEMMPDETEAGRPGRRVAGALVLGMMLGVCLGIGMFAATERKGAMPIAGAGNAGAQVDAGSD